MKLLGIDTTGIVTTVVYNNDGVVSCVEIPFKKHSENLFSALEQLLAKNDIPLEEIDCFGVVVGPGSFTGIRIGLAVIKAFAYVHGRRVVPVNSLEVIAYNKFGITSPEPFWACIDAGAGKVYAQYFNTSLLEEGLPQLVELQSLAKVLKNSGTGKLVTTTPEVFDGLDVQVSEVMLRPEALAELFKAKFEAGALVEHATANPIYLRLSQAELNIGLKEGVPC